MSEKILDEVDLRLVGPDGQRLPFVHMDDGLHKSTFHYDSAQGVVKVDELRIRVDKDRNAVVWCEHPWRKPADQEQNPYVYQEYPATKDSGPLTLAVEQVRVKFEELLAKEKK